MFTVNKYFRISLWETEIKKKWDFFGMKNSAGGLRGKNLALCWWWESRKMSKHVTIEKKKSAVVILSFIVRWYLIGESGVNGRGNRKMWQCSLVIGLVTFFVSNFAFSSWLDAAMDILTSFLANRRLRNYLVSKFI